MEVQAKGTNHAGLERFEVIVDTRNLELGFIPQVSMIVPVYNVAPYVEDCLQSIIASADGISLELIVIDDGSTDESVMRIKSIFFLENWPQTLFLRQENKGLSAVRNLGVNLARGKYLGFLDSDDLILPGTLRLMLSMADADDCEVVLGRTEIFDSLTSQIMPFYDTLIWNRLLAGCSSRVINANFEPLLLSLEPNVNYRIISRKFYIEQNLSFPEGLVFEDSPNHFKMLLAGRRIGLHGCIHYRYRINRHGKITEEKGEKRFDVIKVARQGFSVLETAKVTEVQGGAALRVLFRLIWGCGVMTLPDQRDRFFGEACELFENRIPATWLRQYIMQNQDDIRHCLLGLLLAGKGRKVLAGLSHGYYPMIAVLNFLRRDRNAFALFQVVFSWVMAKAMIIVQPSLSRIKA